MGQIAKLGLMRDFRNLKITGILNNKNKAGSPQSHKRDCQKKLIVTQAHKNLV